MRLSCVIVDDEPLALSMLESYVRKTDFLSLNHKFSSAALALGWLEGNRVDLVFLDIQMPDINGLDIARKLDQFNTDGSTRVIFTTAYSQYALDGYTVQALDYLLKPYNFDDFSAAAEKARLFFGLIRPSGNGEQKDSEEKYIYLKVGYETVRVETTSILYLESAKDYVKVYLEGEVKPLMTYSTLKNLNKKLPSGKFLKIHRSFVIAKDKLKSVSKTSVGIADTTIPVTENYRDEFLKLIENWK